jgi:hypothetical protein
MNNWLKYVTRSYEQIKTDLLARAGVEIPELTDHNDSNIYTKILSMWAGISEMLGYYIDNAAREVFLWSNRRYVSALKLAFNHDYSVHYKIAATADLSFIVSATTPSDITIPLGTIVTTEDGLKYETLEVGTIVAGESETLIPSAQYTTTKTGVSLGFSDGTENQIFTIPDNTVADKTVMIYLDNEFWVKQKTLGYSKPSDEHFTQSVTITEDVQKRQLPIILFGDNFNGKIPAAGTEIFTTYKTTEGLQGNRASNTITEITTPITVPTGLELICTNVNRASNGDDIESLNRLKYRIPRAIRTLQRAVTRQDFKDITEIVGGVAAGYVDFNCGKTVTIFVSPIGGGIASSDLLAKVTTALSAEDVRIVTTRLNVEAAGEVIIQLSINITALPQYQNTFVKSGIETNLTEFLSPENQEIFGTVFLSDVYEVIENTTGVANSEIIEMRGLPYARPIGTENPLNWVISVNGNVDNIDKWKVRIITGDKYQLFKNGSFIGNFDIGTQYVLGSITLTVNSDNYDVGNTWDFVTYPYFGTVNLEEPSVPISRLENITLNVNGGL